MFKNKYGNILKSSEIGNFIKIYFGSAKAIIILSISLKRKLLFVFSFVRNGSLLALQKR